MMENPIKSKKSVMKTAFRAVFDLVGMGLEGVFSDSDMDWFLWVHLTYLVKMRCVGVPIIGVATP